MSMILKGINLPSKGNYLNIVIFADGAVYTKTNCGEDTEKAQAVQIPKDHGKLVDSKEILARAEQEVDGLVMSAEHLPMVVAWILDKCDTFLEAEEEER